MKPSYAAVLVLYLGFLVTLDGAKPKSRSSSKPPPTPMTKDQELKTSISSFATQMVQQQAFIEERIRSEGDSGIKQVRRTISGTKSYFSASHAQHSVASIHDHANNIRTCGMGEYSVVMNGVEFRTRHNDYGLNMPHRTETKYHATEPIEFPDVPPEVTNKRDVNDQIAEMREWFKAWQSGDRSKRDYTKYFKPVLCYMEGAWLADSKTFEESFFSDRHQLDASSWFDLQQKVRYNSYTGRKDHFENFAFLPTKIFGFTNTSIPIPLVAQWNYRILCHPLKKDVPLNRLKVVDDLNIRIRHGKSLEEYANTRAARFQLDPFNKGDYRMERYARYGLLDELMYEIPGKDNYKGQVTDAAMDETAFKLDGGKLNAAFYHRWYKVSQKGAMGLQFRARGFSDDNMFVAFNTQEKVASVTLKDCQGSKCKTYESRVSYAFPLELIYMTPLSKWNPYDIEYKGLHYKDEGKTVYANGRNGGLHKSTAYNGANSILYYMTPTEFYSGDEVGSTSADTSPKGTIGVLDKRGNVRKVRSSGHRIVLPDIPGVGMVRQRYPIMPVHGSGSTVWKELDALKDMILNSEKYQYMFYESSQGTGAWKGSPKSEPKKQTNEKPTQTKKPAVVKPPPVRLVLKTSPATKTPPGPHTHTITFTEEEFKTLMVKRIFTKVSSLDNGHSHKIEVVYNKGRNQYFIRNCDSKKYVCWDGHNVFLSVVKN